MCLNPTPELMIPPSEKARDIGDYFRVAVYLNFGLGFLLLSTSQYILGFFSLLFALVGYLAVRSDTGFSLRQILCYSIGTTLYGLYTALSAFYFYSGKSDSAPTDYFFFYVYNYAMIGGIALYVLAIAIAAILYKELKRNAADYIASGAAPPPPPVQPTGFGGMFGGGQPAQQQQQQAPADSSSGGGGPLQRGGTAPPSNFRAFSGAGNRLT